MSTTPTADHDRHNVAIAVANLVCGWTLTFIDYFVSTADGVHESVLWVLGQTFIFAGCLLGVKSYVDFRINNHRYEDSITRHMEGNN